MNARIVRWIAAALVILLLATLALAEEVGTAPTQAPEAEDVQPAETGDAQPGVGDDTAEEAPQPANGYVLVTTSTQAGWLPLPDEGEYSYHLKQQRSDGTETENVIHLTPNGVYMEDSTCDNHDCVEQGEVTLENRKDRILSNMIICLPNQVSLALYTPEEVLELFADQQAQDGDGAEGD